MIIFPSKTNQRYYDLHYQYVLNIFRHCNLPITLRGMPQIHPTKFECIINNLKVLFDFSDGSDIYEHGDKYEAYFKFHYYNEHKNYPYITPFIGITHHVWDRYFHLNKQVYSPSSKKILNNQKIYGNAKERRIHVKELLSKNFDNVDMTITDQATFLQKLKTCYCYVHAPGFANNMLDRASAQALSLGSVLVTTHIPEILPYNISFEPNVDYLMCSNDYSDLVKILKEHIQSVHRGIEISKNCQTKFETYFTPKKLWEWIQQTLSKAS